MEGPSTRLQHTTDKGMKELREWLCRALDEIRENVPLEKLHGGERFKMHNEVKPPFELLTEYGFVSICFARLVRQSGSESQVREIFEWEKYDEANFEVDRNQKLGRLWFDFCGKKKLLDHDNHEVCSNELGFDEDSTVAKEFFQETMLDYNIPVVYMPLVVAMKFFPDGPPRHQDVTLAPESSTNHNNDDSIKIFVSHRWKAPNQPSLETDWSELLEFFPVFVHRALQACVWLMRMDFPLESVLNLVSDEPAYPFEDLYSNNLARDGYVLVSASLSISVLRLAARNILKDWEKYAFQPQECWRRWKTCMASSFLLWYDYCSLPQSPDRTDQQERVFKDSLARLSEIQRSMHTLSLDTTLTYLQRGWCVAEWMNAGDVGCSSCNRGSGSGSPCYTRLVLETRALWYLCDPSKTYKEIMTFMKLAFTDEEHDCFVSIVCWIIWSALARSNPLELWKQLLLAYQEGLLGHQMLVGKGRAKSVAHWLELLLGTFCDSREPDYDYYKWKKIKDETALDAEDSVDGSSVNVVEKEYVLEFVDRSGETSAKQVLGRAHEEMKALSDDDQTSVYVVNLVPASDGGHVLKGNAEAEFMIERLRDYKMQEYLVNLVRGGDIGEILNGHAEADFAMERLFQTVRRDESDSGFGEWSIVIDGTS